MADLFSVKKKIQRYQEEAEVIELLKGIVKAFEEGKRNVTVGYPTGLPVNLVNMIRSYGFKVHTIELKEAKVKDTKTTIIQW